jgi:hypothetical protein
MYAPKRLEAALGISGTFEYRDAAGNVLKTVQVSGSIPLSELGLTQEQAQDLIENNNNKGTTHGSDHCERMPEGGA